jgi:hypothetical protein
MLIFVAYFSPELFLFFSSKRREICHVTHQNRWNLAWRLLSDKCAKVIVNIKNSLHSPSFIARHRRSEKDFTRQRKLPFHLLVCFLADFVKGAYQSELDKFFQALHGDVVPQRRVSKAALTKARSKLNFEAFVELNQKLITIFHTVFSPRKWHGFRLLAVDSTTIRLPRLRAIASHFGAWKPRQGRHCPMARASLLFDSLNRITIGAVIDPKAVNERHQAKQLLAYLQPKDLLLLDRGYPAFWLFKLISQKHAHYCARMPINLLPIKKLVSSGQKEKIIHWHIPVTSEQECSQVGVDTQPLTLRLIRVDRDNNPPVFLATSLTDCQQYPYELFVDLYQHRWPVEEDYKTIKCRLEIENFTGKTVLSIYQDFYAKVFFKNLTAVLSFPIQQKLELNGTKQKHVHQVNFAHALAVSKRITMLLLQKPLQHITHIIQMLHHIFAKTSEPVRPGRLYPRFTKSQERRFFPAYKPIC